LEVTDEVDGDAPAVDGGSVDDAAVVDVPAAVDGDVDDVPACVEDEDTEEIECPAEIEPPKYFETK